VVDPRAAKTSLSPLSEQRQALAVFPAAFFILINYFGESGSEKERGNR